MSEYPTFQGDFFRKKSGFHHVDKNFAEVAVFSHLRANDELFNEDVH